jgi:hypothetical protein
MIDLTTPIFILEKGNMMVYPSIKAAQSDLEAIDVKNGEYVAYDANGHLLSLEAINNSVFISLVNHTKHTDELKSGIKTFLQNLGDPVGEDNSYDLPFLIDYCRKFIEPCRLTRLEAFINWLLARLNRWGRTKLTI